MKCAARCEYSRVQNARKSVNFCVMDFPLAAPPKKILIVRLSSIGDCVLASPVVEALRERYPDAHLTWAVQIKSASVVQKLPGLDATLLWDDTESRWPSLARALWKAHRGAYDVALDLQGLDKAGLFALASGASRRITGEGARRVTRWVCNEHVPEVRGIHARDFYLRRAARLDIAEDAATRFFPRVPVTALHRRFADEFLRAGAIEENHRVVGLNLGAAHANKRWPPVRFAQLADALLRGDASTRIIVFGAPSDSGLFEQFETELAHSRAGNSSATLELIGGARRDSPRAEPEVAAPGDAWRGRVLAAVGRADLLQLAAISERCDAFVTGDTGPMHIAAAVGAPMVALFAPTLPSRTGPVQKPDGGPIRVLTGREPSTQERASMESIEVATVLKEVRELIAVKARRSPKLRIQS